MTLTTLALTFVLSAVVIVAAGTVLARSGDVIAARTGLGRLWVGSVFLALATSLPEITTDIAAVRLGAPDLAAGDLFGGTMANVLILALISLVPAGREIFQKATLDHVLYASLAVVMTCVAAITILVRPTVSVLRVGPASLLLVAMYAVGSRAAYRHGTLARHAAERVEMSGLAADTPEGVGPAEAPAVGLALGITAAAAPSERTGDCAGEPTAAELVVGMPEFYLARGRVDRGGGRRRAVGAAGDPGATEHGVARRGFGGCVGGVPNGTNGLVPGDGRAESAPNRNCPHRVPASCVRVLRRLTARPRQRRMMHHAYLEQRTRPPWQHALRRCRERQGRARRSSREAERRRVAHAGGPSNQEDVT